MAIDLEVHDIAGPFLLDHTIEFRHRADGLPISFNYDVSAKNHQRIPHQVSLPPAANPSLRERVIRLGARHQNTVIHRQIQCLSKIWCQLVSRKAGIGAPDAALRDQIGNDGFGGVDRNGKANPDVAAAGGKNLAIDADQFPLRVQERAT